MEVGGQGADFFLRVGSVKIIADVHAVFIQQPQPLRRHGGQPPRACHLKALYIFQLFPGKPDGVQVCHALLVPVQKDPVPIRVDFHQTVAAGAGLMMAVGGIHTAVC